MHVRSLAVQRVMAALDADPVLTGRGSRFRVTSIASERLPAWSVYALRSRVRRSHTDEDETGGPRTVVLREIEIGVRFTVRAGDGLDEDLDAQLARAEAAIFASAPVAALCHDGSPDVRGDEIVFDREQSQDMAAGQITVVITIKTPEGDPETILT
jgi:hypothetical protein